jgi:hypothetical protein
MKFIVTTTIYSPSPALLKFVSFSEWTTIIVGDKKTPEEPYKNLQETHTNVLYLSCEYQEKMYKNLSDMIGWNKIQRRNIGFIEALKRGGSIIASVDDDNIPLDKWGQNLHIGKEVSVYYYETTDLAFDPISATNYKNLWHRGFPIQDLFNRNASCKLTIKTIIPDIQADFWNGDPDVDAICRFEHRPCCFFDDKYFPLATNAFSPFNSQNTFFSREALKKYLVIPYIGRMDDIWASYYLESLGFKVVYTKASVFQDRNVQNLTRNMVDEFNGYETTTSLLSNLKTSHENFNNYLPQMSIKIIEEYQSITRDL